jgi:hypothetical protein
MRRMNQNHPVEVRSQEASNESKAVNSIEERGSNPTPRTITEHPTFNKNLDGTMDAILMPTM